MPDYYWLVMVVFVDVAHVYSTLFKTYFDRQNFSLHRNLYLIVPIVCYVVGVMLHSESSMFYWRLLAYLAVFHFIRQQYGFFRLYSRKEEMGNWTYYLDNVTIYMATLYPIVYWHTHPDTPFSWFVENDFLTFRSEVTSATVACLYAIVLIAYVVKEIVLAFMNKRINVPKNLILIGTAASWYLSIIYFKSDMAFTTINILSHGLPYMALIYAEGKKASLNNTSKVLKTVFQKSYGILVFVALLILFAYFEEGLWDALVWQEHKVIFPAFHQLLPFLSNANILALLVPLLSLPQTTHYVLDGFIWKREKQG